MSRVDLNRFKGEVVNGDAVGLSQSQIDARVDAELGSATLLNSLEAAFASAAAHADIPFEHARLLLVNGVQPRSFQTAPSFRESLGVGTPHG